MSIVKRSVALLAAVVLTCLALPNTDNAHAFTFCVAPSPEQSPQCDLRRDGVQAAFDAATTVPGGDKILIGPGDFSDGPFCYVADDPLTMVGEGADATTLTMNGAATSCGPGLPSAVLTLSNKAFAGSGRSHIVLSNLGVRIPASADTAGMVLEGAFAHSAKVTTDPGAVRPTGVVLQGVDGRFSSGAIIVPVEGSIGVHTTAALPTITQSRITAVTGVLSDGILVGPFGSILFVTSSIITIASAPAGPDAPPVGLLVNGIAGIQNQQLLLFARNLTIYGSGRDADVGVDFEHDPNSPGEVDIFSTVIDNVGFSAARRPAGGTAVLESLFSSYTAPVDDGGTTRNAPYNDGLVVFGSSVGSPGFVDAAAGDFRLRPRSPLIDQGDPLALGEGFDSPLDAGGNPRLLDGTISPRDPGCFPRRDIGALEFKPDVLLARIAAVDGAIVGRPVELDASGSCDPNPEASLAFRWTFDDGGTAGGGRVMHAFATTGDHDATVNVTSSDGRRSSATTTVVVSPAAKAAVGTKAKRQTFPNRDKTPPRARRLDIRPRSFRAAGAGASIARSIGAAVRFRLSEPARLRFSVQRLKPRRKSLRGRRKYASLRGIFTYQGRANSNKFRFTGRVAGRKLRPGHYRLVGVPTDASGNHGKSVRARFRVVRR